MYGWGKKRPPADTPEQLERAYRLGQNAGERIANDLELIMGGRFKPVFEGYLAVLRKQIHDSFDSDDGPPITIARMDYGIFLENVEKLKPQITEEIRQHMDGWLKLADEADVRTETEALIAKRIDDFLIDLTLTGLKLLTDYAEALKEADDAWRVANPQKATEFPVRGLIGE